MSFYISDTLIIMDTILGSSTKFNSQNSKIYGKTLRQLEESGALEQGLQKML